MRTRLDIMANKESMRGMSPRLQHIVQPKATYLTVGCRCGVVSANSLVILDNEKATGTLE